VCVCVCVCVCILRPHTTTQEELRAEYYFANLPKQAQTFPAANPPLQPMVLTPVASHSGTRALPPLPPPSASLRAPSPAGSAFVCCKCVARGLVIVPVCNQCESTALTALCVRSQSSAAIRHTKISSHPEHIQCLVKLSLSRARALSLARWLSLSLASALSLSLTPCS
jgi:hypothetical protein